MAMLPRAAAAFGLAAALLMPAHAGIFDDDEARKAILDLRAKLEASNEANRAKQAELNTQMADQLSQLKRSLLDLNNQIELLRGDMARMRGENEQLTRDVAELQRKQKDVTSGIDIEVDEGRFEARAGCGGGGQIHFQGTQLEHRQAHDHEGSEKEKHDIDQRDDLES